MVVQESEPDPILGENSIHWLVCRESYKSERSPIIGIDDEWILGYQDEETCIYHQVDVEGTVLDYCIIGFRGTAATGDIYDDYKLSIKGNKGDFPRAQEGIQFTRQFMEQNPELIIQLTGHSLGGAIARITGQTLGLGIVTFNAAAPPTNPVETGPNEIDYHIVFDIISAWQQPNTIRIDKGYRPMVKYQHSIIPKTWLKNVVSDLAPAHSLSNFSNEKPGKIIQAKSENYLIQLWFYMMPQPLRILVMTVLLGFSGKFSLPEIN